MPQVQGGNRLGASPLGHRNNDGIDQPETERPVFAADRVRTDEILVYAMFDGEGTVGQIGQEGLLRASAKFGATR